jgi:hypothetical protein
MPAIAPETLDGYWIVEYSGKQKCFHLEEIDTRLSSSLDDCIKQHGRDWYTVGIVKNEKEGYELIEILKNKQN